MKTERAEKRFAVYESPQMNILLEIPGEAGFAASAEIDPMTETDGEW